MNSFSAVSLTPAINFRPFGYFWPVSTTPAINCSTVSTTPPITTEFWAFCKTNSGHRSRPRPLKSATAADIVIGTATKRCKGPSHALRPLRPPKLLQTKTVAASGASDQDVWVVYGCNFSWRFQWHHRRPLTPVININLRIYPRIFEKIQNVPNGILGGLGDTDSWKKTEIENLVSDSL
jgi:hypothetical protein